MIFFPNAKINLGLNVVGKRRDGYHNIESIFLPVNFTDALEVIPLKDINSSYNWQNSGLIVDTPSENNICIKALNLLKEEGYKIPPTNIQLHKNIPFGAGLGGGSSDGAFMLKLLNEYFELGISNLKLKTFALQLGADCSFFIDNTPSFVTGIGDKIKPIKVDLKNYTIVIIVPNIHVSTPLAYNNITPHKPEHSLLESIEKPTKLWKDLIFNDFEKPVFVLFPEIKSIKDYMYKNGAIYASMSGSGSAVFGIFEQNPNIVYANSKIWVGNIV